MAAFGDLSMTVSRLTAFSWLVDHMSKGRRTMVAFGLVITALLASYPALADESEDDQDVARELHDRGDIGSLRDILKRIEQQDHLVVVNVDLVHVGDRWVYRLQVVAPDGRRSTVEVDAGSSATSARSGDD